MSAALRTALPHAALPKSRDHDRVAEAFGADDRDPLSVAGVITPSDTGHVEVSHRHSGTAVDGLQPEVLFLALCDDKRYSLIVRRPDGSSPDARSARHVQHLQWRSTIGTDDRQLIELVG